MTSEQLADLLFASKQTVAKWENDKSIPDIETLIRLSTLLDLDLAELLKENGASAHGQPPATKLQAQETACVSEPRKIEVLEKRSDSTTTLFKFGLIGVAVAFFLFMIAILFFGDKNRTENIIEFIISIPVFSVCLIAFLIQKNIPKAAIILCGEERRIYNGGKYYKQIKLREIDTVREIYTKYSNLTKYGSLRIKTVTEKSVATAIVSNVSEVYRKIIEAKMIAKQRAR